MYSFVQVHVAVVDEQVQQDMHLDFLAGRPVVLEHRYEEILTHGGKYLEHVAQEAGDQNQGVGDLPLVLLEGC